MALIIETGAVVANANSYGVADAATTRAAARAYALDRGVVLPAIANPDPIDPMLIKGTDYIETKKRFFVGRITDSTQVLSWPRQCVYINCVLIDSHTLPQQLLKALYQLCIEQNAGTVLIPSSDPTVDGGFVVRERVDVIETQYSERIGTAKTPILRAVDSLLEQLVWNSSPFGLKSVRV